MTNKSCNIQLEVDIPPYYAITVKTAELGFIDKGLSSTTTHRVDSFDDDKMRRLEDHLEPILVFRTELSGPVILGCEVNEILHISASEAIPPFVAIGLIKDAIMQVAKAVTYANDSLAEPAKVC